MAFRRSPVRSRSGPPSFAHECRRRMPRRSVATRRGGGPVPPLNELRLGKPSFARRLSRRIRVAAKAPSQPQRGRQRLCEPPRSSIAETASVLSACDIRRVLRLSVRHLRCLCLGMPKTSDSSTFSRTPIPDHTSTSASHRMSTRAWPTTTPAAAHTLRATAHGSSTSPSIPMSTSRPLRALSEVRFGPRLREAALRVKSTEGIRLRGRRRSDCDCSRDRSANGHPCLPRRSP